jgi:hypothetical protein
MFKKNIWETFFELICEILSKLTPSETGDSGWLGLKCSACR